MFSRQRAGHFLKVWRQGSQFRMFTRILIKSAGETPQNFALHQPVQHKVHGPTTAEVQKAAGTKCRTPL